MLREALKLSNIKNCIKSAPKPSIKVYPTGPLIDRQTGENAEQAHATIFAH